MKIIFIRHAEPAYESGSITEKGVKEAACLALRVKDWKVDDIFVSPLLRARQTAEPCLKALGKEAVDLPWIREFDHCVYNKILGRDNIPWNFFPVHFFNEPEFFDKDTWYDAPTLRTNPEVKSAAIDVFTQFDNLLKEYGYERDGNTYRILKESPKSKESTIVIFCHLGVSLLVMGHLFGISPSVLWQAVYLPPTGVTVIGTEERDGEYAMFRVQMIGDTSHLRMMEEPVSYSGVFYEPFQG